MNHNPETCPECKKREESRNAYWKSITRSESNVL